MSYSSAIQTVVSCDLRVRFATPSEFPALLDLQAESLRGLSGDRYDARQVESLVKGQRIERERRDEIVLVAERNARLLGFVSLHPRRASLSGIYVRPNCARQGVGKQLLAEAENLACHHRARSMYVLSSQPAIEFYRSQGYRYINQTGFYSIDSVWIPCTRFRKALVPLNPFEQCLQNWFGPFLDELF